MPDEPKKLPSSLYNSEPRILNQLKGEEYQRGINLILKVGYTRQGAEGIMDTLISVSENNDIEQEIRGFIDDLGINLNKNDFNELARCVRAILLIDKKMN